MVRTRDSAFGLRSCAADIVGQRGIAGMPEKIKKKKEVGREEEEKREDAFGQEAGGRSGIVKMLLLLLLLSRIIKRALFRDCTSLHTESSFWGVEAALFWKGGRNFFSGVFEWQQQKGTCVCSVAGREQGTSGSLPQTSRVFCLLHTVHRVGYPGPFCIKTRQLLA